MTRAELDTLIAAAKQRQDDANKGIQELQQQAQSINAKGVELERLLLGIDGELKALSAIAEKVTD